MKTIIEDLVARHEGREETVLPERTRIRFEVGNTKLTFYATEEGVEVYKVNDHGMEDTRIMTVGISSNKFLIK